MRITKAIDNSLIKENGQYHEASSCEPCVPEMEIRRAKWIDEKDLKNSDFAGLPVYYKDNKTLMMPFSHVLVTGSSGTGKSEVFYKNQIKLLAKLPDDKKPSLLVSDLKGDISEQQMEYLRNNGYNVIRFNMRDTYRTARYNFLLPIYQDYEEAMRIKKLIVTGVITPIFDGVKYSSVAEATAAASARYYTLIDSVERAIIEVAFIVVTNTTEKDKMWNDGARTMLRAIIWTMLRCSEKPEYGMTADKFTVANICRIASSTENDCALIIKWLKLAEDITCVKSAITSNYGLNAKVTRDGYIATLNTAISEYNSKAIEAMTATSSEIDLRKVARSKEPYAIFVVTDERQKTTNNICTMLINNLVNELVEAADRNPNHSLPRDFVFLIDEFANIPALPNLSNKITTFRSRRIWLTMAIQSVQQLKMVYGEETSEILKDNCDLQIFLGCNNDETKEAFVRSMGMKIGVKTSYAIASDGSMSASRGTENVPVITKSDLDSLNLGEFYVRSRQCRNIKSYMEPYFMQEDCYKWRLTGAEKFRFVNSAKNEYSIKFVDEKQSLAPNSTAKPF